MPEVVRLSAGGAELGDLLSAVTADDGATTSRRRLLGIAGAPGAGKSTLAEVASRLVDGSAVVPMDGFHLSDAVLEQLGLRDLKGAPESFDGWGYAALLQRLRSRPSHTVYAPGFERSLEQPLAAAVAVDAAVDLVVTEGNYLLLDEPAWRSARAALDAVWFVEVDEELRGQRLRARHEAFGKTRDEAAAWMERVDEPNAAAVAGTRGQADLVLDLTDWRPSS